MSTELSESYKPADIDRAAAAWADLGGATFLNFAGHAAMPRMAVAAACASAESKGRPVAGDAARFFDASERVRSSLAQLLGARAGDIALTTGAGPGAAIVALGLTWRPGDDGLFPCAAGDEQALVEAQQLYRSAGYAEVAPFNNERYAHHWFRKAARSKSEGVGVLLVDVTPSWG